MPVTANVASRIRTLTRRAWSMRTQPITLTFAGERPDLVVNGIWKANDTADPRFAPPVSVSSPSATTADAIAAFLLDDVALDDLAAALSFRPPAATDLRQSSGTQGEYMAIAIQPKGMVPPPDRAFVWLRRV